MRPHSDILPSLLYAQACLAGTISPDYAQRLTLPVLDHLVERVRIREEPSYFACRPNLLKAQGKAALYRGGIYLYGPVGRGKTFLMDLMTHCGLSHCIRAHFHAFMQSIHRDLQTHQGKMNPLEVIAEKWADSCYLLCLDEFMVTDIADAMILKSLLEEFLKKGIYWIITSNTPPQDLYLHGLQRVKFLPAIALIQNAFQVLSVAGEQDYRQHFLTNHTPFFFEDSAYIRQALYDWYLHLGGGEVRKAQILSVLDRPLATLGVGNKVIWISFESICNTPRHTADYVELAARYPFWIISQVPVLKEEDNAAVLRFVHLIDALYDQKCFLVLQLKTKLDFLYKGSTHSFAFARTLSRLHELQSSEYGHLSQTSRGS